MANLELTPSSYATALWLFRSTCNDLSEQVSKKISEGLPWGAGLCATRLAHVGNALIEMQSKLEAADV